MKDLTPNFRQSQAYRAFIEENKAIYVETVFTSQWTLIEGYHLIGENLRKADFGVPISELLHGSAEDMGISERTLYYALKFYDKFPNLDMLKGGKAVSWTKIKVEYLTDGSEDTKDEELFITCPTCKGQGKIKK